MPASLGISWYRSESSILQNPSTFSIKKAFIAELLQLWCSKDITNPWLHFSRIKLRCYSRTLNMQINYYRYSTQKNCSAEKKNNNKTFHIKTYLKNSRWAAYHSICSYLSPHSLPVSAAVKAAPHKWIFHSKSPKTLLIFLCTPVPRQHKQNEWYIGVWTFKANSWLLFSLWSVSVEIFSHFVFYKASI